MCTTGSAIESRRRGFTMVEIIVVITILSVIGAMTAVSLSGAIGGVAAKESAITLLASLRYAHDYAAIHGCECRVTLSRTENTYELTYNVDPTKDEYQRLPSASHSKLAEHVRFISVQVQAQNSEKPADVISFQPTGEADAAAIVISDGRDTYSLIVSPASGMTTLKHGLAVNIASDREDLDA